MTDLWSTNWNFRLCYPCRFNLLEKKVFGFFRNVEKLTSVADPNCQFCYLGMSLWFVL